MRKMASISTKLLRGVGFSKGWAELALKKPPPLTPSCLMAICEAAGPWGSTCSFDDHRFGQRLALCIFEGLTGGVQFGLFITGRLEQVYGLIRPEVLNHPLGDQ